MLLYSMSPAFKVVVGVVWLVFTWWYLAVLIAPTRPGNVVQTEQGNVASTRIVLPLTDALQDKNLIFGVLHVRDGKDDVPGSGDPVNEEIPFKAIDRSGMIEATIRYQKNLGFQYKCYVDYSSDTYENVQRRLQAAGFENISMGEGVPHRIFFTIKGKPLYTTIDGLINNFFYPA
jgi:hypothetical protein